MNLSGPSKKSNQKIKSTNILDSDSDSDDQGVTNLNLSRTSQKKYKGTLDNIKEKISSAKPRIKNQKLRKELESLQDSILLAREISNLPYDEAAMDIAQQESILNLSEEQQIKEAKSRSKKSKQIEDRVRTQELYNAQQNIVKNKVKETAKKKMQKKNILESDSDSEEN